jgi:hypothetical protein
MEELKKKYERRLNFINQAILNVNSGKYVIFDISKMADLLTEKEQIQEWLQDPRFVILAMTFKHPRNLSDQNHCFIHQLGFITGLFLGIFVALVLEAIKSRRESINRPES